MADKRNEETSDMNVEEDTEDQEFYSDVPRGTSENADKPEEKEHEKGLHEQTEEEILGTE